MFDYLQKFNALPQNLRDSVSSPISMAIISELEKIYKIDLAAIVMKVMVKSILLSDLAITFVSDFSLDQDSAKKLTAEMKERLFFPVANYLGYIASYSSVMPKVAPISNLPIADRVTKETGVFFPGNDLNQRLKTVLNTYLKGIRSRIDTRITLNKEIISGGLGLDHKIIDKIFTSCDKFSSFAEKTSIVNITEPVKSGLEKVRALYEKPGASRDMPYDLSAVIAKGVIIKSSVPFNLPVPEEAKEKLLAKPTEELLISAPIKKEVPLENTPIKQFNIPIVEYAPLPLKSVLPEIKNIASITEFKKIIPPVVIPTISTPPAPKPNVTVKIPNPIDILAPSVPAKIIKPAEKAPSLWSKMFNSNPIQEKPTLRPVPPVMSNLITPPNSSIAAKRMQAAASLRTEAPRMSAPVRQVPRVMSPIDELKFLDLVNFRRLGTSPAEVIAKISSKIKLLEKDGYEKMISGITAWKQSPVNKIYLKMGQEALKNGQSLKDFAMAAQEAKTPGVLSWEEIQLVIKLNNQFMF